MKLTYNAQCKIATQQEIIEIVDKINKEADANFKRHEKEQYERLKQKYGEEYEA